MRVARLVVVVIGAHRAHHHGRRHGAVSVARLPRAAAVHAAVLLKGVQRDVGHPRAGGAQDGGRVVLPGRAHARRAAPDVERLSGSHAATSKNDGEGGT